MNRSTFVLVALTLASLTACTTTSPVTNYYEISTPHGEMVIRLYDETPLHRDNFRTLVEQGILDGTLFHRVMQNFMIQGGDPNSKDSDPSNDGMGGPGYTVAAEFNYPAFYHKRGALAAARQPDQVNPAKESSGSQFYIVHGQTWTSEELDMLEQQVSVTRPGFQIPPDLREVYTTIGGYPPLDGDYTVFGELIDGGAVLDSIAATPTTGSFPRMPNRPLIDVPMTVRPLFDYKE